MKSIARSLLLEQACRRLSGNKGVVLLGPRQCGKTTLARSIANNSKDAVAFFDLENPVDLARLADPMLALEPLRGLVILDEIQRRPEIMSVLRVLLDREPLPARFLLLGSASPDIVKGASESLAGRVAFVDMHGFNLQEVGIDCMQRLWLRGGFPLSLLAETDGDSMRWRLDFIRTFLERDLPSFGHNPGRDAIRNFLSMLAHYHGQTWNASEIARSLQITHPTTRHYADLLTGSFLVRQLPPWFENAGKRIVKSPKIYIRDTGILHALMNLDSMHALQGHPKLGASWEGFALENLLSVVEERHAYFWATQSGAELDLLYNKSGKRLGAEFKYSSTPSITRSMRIAVSDLKLDHLYVVYPGTEQFALSADITAIGLSDIMQLWRE